MNLFYFGTDNSWIATNKIGFYRRNTWILKSFVENQYFKNIYIVHQTSRLKIFRKILKRNTKSNKDIYYFNLFPTSFESNLFNLINKKIIKLLFVIQGVKQINSKENIIWAYWSSGYKKAETVNLKGRYFFDTDHNIIDNNNIEEDDKHNQKKTLLRATNKCEMIISSSRSMLSWYKEQGFSNLYRLRNGICLNRFSKIIKTQTNIKPIIGYVGTLSKWINYNLFELLIKNNPNWDFFIYGKNYKTDEYIILEKYKNVYLKGELSPINLPETIGNFDIALNLYKNEKWLDVDSMKIYEYLAANIPVVTTNFHDYLKEDFNNLLYIGGNYKEIENHIKNILKNKILNFEKYNKWLQQNTWKERVNQIINELL